MATEEITISELELADEVLGDMVIPVDTTTDTKAVTLRQLKSWLGSSLPTGFIIPAVGRISDERFTLLDGKTLARDGTYQAFCNKVVSEVQAGNWFACTAQEYEADLTNHGQCGRFVITNDYIRIPTITKFMGATITLSEIGESYIEVFSKINNVASSGVTYTDKNYIYGKFPYYMVISTEGQTSPIEIDINEVYEDLNLKANSDLSNVPNSKGILVESYQNGSSWYRVYSDGWCEQGGRGIHSANNKVVTLLKTMGNTNYSVFVQWIAKNYSTYFSLVPSDLTTSSFIISSYTQFDNKPFQWQACGYIS